jgi:hypothetical protein
MSARGEVILCMLHGLIANLVHIIRLAWFISLHDILDWLTPQVRLNSDA